MDWADFEELPRSDDRNVENAVAKIGQIAFAGHGRGYIFNAAAVRKILFDVQRETALECLKLARIEGSYQAEAIKERFGLKEKA